MSHSSFAIGIDGCRGGWFFVRDRGGDLDFGLVRSLHELLEDNHAQRIGIDMPIGLRERSGLSRHCDRDARRLLGARRSSVFSPPLRGALEFADHAAASAWQKSTCGKGLSIQAFNIGAKIAQVDALMATNKSARGTLIEVHPELCFFGLNDARPVSSSKKSDDGAMERLALLAPKIPSAAQVLEKAMGQFLRKDVARDDIIDALGVLVASKATADQTMTVPQFEELDARGLPMRIMFYLAQSQRRRIRDLLDNA